MKYNEYNTMNILSALWVLMAWCFKTVLSMHLYISMCLGVKTELYPFNLHLDTVFLYHACVIYLPQ